MKSLLTKLFNSLFGCNHTRTTFPQMHIVCLSEFCTVRYNSITCLDCGIEFYYSFAEMRRGRRVKKLETSSKIG